MKSPSSKTACIAAHGLHAPARVARCNTSCVMNVRLETLGFCISTEVPKHKYTTIKLSQILESTAGIIQYKSRRIKSGSGYHVEVVGC